VTPSYLIYLDIDPQAIDVNIHPTKTEIKFSDEQAIFQILLAAVKEALGKFNVAPSLDFTSTTQLDIPAARTGAIPVQAPILQVDPNYDPFKTQTSRSNPISGWEQLYEPIQSHIPGASTTVASSMLFDTPLISDATPLLQCANRYILAPIEQGLMLIHQHRMHVAILYNELQEQLTQSQAITQPLLFPEIIELTYDDWQTLQTLLPDLERLGFTLDQFSPQAYTISAVPALLGQKNAVETLLQVIHDVQDTEGSVENQWKETMTLCLARQMAIPQGKPLTEVEMRDLVNRFMTANLSRHLPNGQTIISILNNDDIQKRF
jgi:DNA mismatch repair protein MutL